MTIQPYICQDHACPSRERCVYHRPKGFGTELSVKAFGREPNEHKCAEFIQRSDITEWESVRRDFRGEPMMETEYVILEYTSNEKLEEDLTTYSEDGYSLVSLNSDTAVLKRPPDECTVWGGPLNGQSISMREALE